MRPKPIVRLSPDVVNRVAAGEVIHRPASALKEMLENSLDAGSRSITVTVRDGGNKLLQVTDDGCGIRDEDLTILCERHTTSKLRTFEDLDAVATFGFRGEALASMSFVANLTVTTMTADAAHATRATYADGKMTPEGATPTAGVPGTTVCVENLFYNVPTRRRALRSASEEFARALETTQRYAASRPDVAFTVRKLGDARPALRCPVVVDVVVEPEKPARFTAKNRVDRVRAIYGDATARRLAPLAFSAGGWTPLAAASEAAAEKASASDVGADGGDGEPDEQIRFAVDALVSVPSYRSRKTTFVLFINDRLVECAPLRRACELAYAAALPKSEKPFLFVALSLPRETVDVNVHPTKREVRFLHQDAIVASVARRVSAVLEAHDETRAFANRGGLPVAPGAGDAAADRDASARAAPSPDGPDEARRAVRERAFDEAIDDLDSPNPRPKRPKTTTRDLVARDHKLVRTDANQAAGSLDAFVSFRTGEKAADERAPPAASARAIDAGVRTGDGSDARRRSSPPEPTARRSSPPRGPNPEPGGARATPAALAEDPAFLAAAAAADGETSPLSSVRELWGEIKTHAHAGLTKMARNMVLVGVCDPGDPNGLWLIQHATKLHAVRFGEMAREFFFQRVVARFGAHRTRRLAERAPIDALVVLALDRERDALEDDVEPEPDDSKQRVDRAAEAARATLAEKAPLLREYFGLDVDEPSGSIAGLPDLVEGFEPDLRGLPELALALAQEVDWTEEKACFRTVADAVAAFYAGTGAFDFFSGESTGSAAAAAAEEAEPERVRSIRQFVFPAMRRCLYPSKISAVRGVVTQLASLEQLYRVFERC